MLNENPFPPSVIERSFPLNEEESRLLMAKGNLLWIRQKPAPLATSGYMDGPRHVYDLEMLPDAEIALLSPTEARIRYSDGREKRVEISGETITVSKIETEEEE